MGTATKVSHYLCIGCPLGCRLEVEERVDDDIEVRGFGCKIGKEFALQEHTAPTRMVTTTVRVRGGLWPRLPVKTARPVPKDRVLAIVQVLHEIEVEAPVHVGDVVWTDASDTGVEVIATRDMPRRPDAGDGSGEDDRLVTVHDHTVLDVELHRLG